MLVDGTLLDVTYRKITFTPELLASLPPQKNDSRPGFKANDSVSHLITLAKDQLLKHT